MSESLACKYRPKTFDEILGQNATLTILKKQIESNKLSHVYLFCGASGAGKTTSARAAANLINKGSGSPIEIDAASNSGVDAVRDIIADAKMRSLDSIYKIFIIDECHSLSTTAWQAFLKCFEEPPEYTIFMLCTTNPEKVPDTIQNRCMRFNIARVNSALVSDRLKYICKNEGFTNYDEACDYLAKLGNGGVRDSIAYLEKCAAYDTDLSITNVLSCLGNFSYDSFFDITGALLFNDIGSIINCIDNYYNAGFSLSVFIDQYLEFLIDLLSYCIFKDMSSVKIPNSLEARCQGYVANVPNCVNKTKIISGNILTTKNMIKNDHSIKSTIQVMLIKTSEALQNGQTN